MSRPLEVPRPIIVLRVISFCALHHKELVPMQPGDVPTTYADAAALERDFGFTPKITLREGLRKFAEWYKQYYC